MAATFENFTLLHVSWDQNERADLVAKLASTQRQGQQRSVIHKNLSALTVDGQGVWCTEARKTWMDPLITYLKEEQLPEDPAAAKRMPREASKYVLIGQHLYRRGFSFPLLRCMDGEEVVYVIREVYEGVCGMHIGGRALASKITRAGYYWPTLRSDCMDYVKKCDKCQRFAEAHKAPPEPLHSVMSPWPFYKWGIDILGPFPVAPGQLKFLIVVVDYFTKWVEAEPVATIT
ncbi:Gypsy retrotransposon integrase-like protein 1, partial [Mucuna pruriens]